MSWTEISARRYLIKTQDQLNDIDSSVIHDLFSVQAFTPLRPRPSSLVSLLDLPAEIRNKIYGDVLAASWTTSRKRRIFSQSTQAKNSRGETNPLARALAFRSREWVPKKDETWKRQAVRPLAFALAFTCKQMYREFAPIFYSQVIMTIDWRVVHDPGASAAVISPRPHDSDLDDRGNLGVSPALHLVTRLCVDVCNSWTQEQARSWLSALSNIADITQGQLRRLSITFYPRPTRSGSTTAVVPEDSDLDTIMSGTLDPELEVDSAKTRAFAEVLTQFHGLDRLCVKDGDIERWAPVLDLDLDYSLRLYKVMHFAKFADWRTPYTESYRVTYLTTDPARLEVMAANNEFDFEEDGSVAWYPVQTLEACLQTSPSRRWARYMGVT